jgi:hypothetical protein
LFAITLPSFRYKPINIVFFLSGSLRSSAPPAVSLLIFRLGEKPGLSRKNSLQTRLYLP